MNSISWFLYLVDILGAVDGLLSPVVVTSFLGVIPLSVGYIISRGHYLDQKLSDEGGKVSYQQKSWYNWFTTWRVGFKIAAYLFIISFIITSIIPSHRTMYLILGSEITEVAIYSETGQKVHQAINKKLDEYLKETE